jgi:hypothetical protein
VGERSIGIAFIYFVFQAGQFIGPSSIHLSRPFRITPQDIAELFFTDLGQRLIETLLY